MEQQEQSVEQEQAQCIDVTKYSIISEIDGHTKSLGREAGKEKNPLWKVMEINNKKEYILMYCETNSICILCPEAYQKIIDYELGDNEGKKLTFFKMQNGYICANNRLYIHQIITGCYGNGAGTKNISVDHIDRNPLNNTIENLRIATRKEQEENSKGIAKGTKRERKHNAKPLPQGLKQDMMRKYVVYYHEWLNTEKTRSREYFKIEEHPKLEKLWIGTKSNKVSLMKKLEIINKIVDNLEINIYPEKELDEDDNKLPPHFSILAFRQKPHLVYDEKINDKRRNLKMVLPAEYNLEEQLDILKEKIKIKYEEN